MQRPQNPGNRTRIRSVDIGLGAAVLDHDHVAAFDVKVAAPGEVIGVEQPHRQVFTIPGNTLRSRIAGGQDNQGACRKIFPEGHIIENKVARGCAAIGGPVGGKIPQDHSIEVESVLDHQKLNLVDGPTTHRRASLPVHIDLIDDNGGSHPTELGRMSVG